MTHHITECIDKITQLHPYAGVMVHGDFNRLKDDSLRSYPLTQLVYNLTRTQAVLDKIYSNIEDWYFNFKPVILPGIGTSDHNAILLSSRQSSTKRNDHRVEVKVCGNDTNGQNLLANTLSDFNWHEMESLRSVDQKVGYFNDCILTKLDYYSPTYSVARHTADELWVTDEFRRLFRQCQYAWMHGQLENYKKLRNMINRLSKQLRQNSMKKTNQRDTPL